MEVGVLSTFKLLDYFFIFHRMKEKMMGGGGNSHIPIITKERT